MPERKPRVLVVDDNLEMARTLAENLCDRAYAAVALGSGSAAADYLKTEKVDALVTDLRVPSVDGLRLLALSRSLAPDRPVLIMTAFSAVDTAVESIRQGAYHYLTKPFKAEELVLFLRRALDESEIRREAVALKRTLRERFAMERMKVVLPGHSNVVSLEDLPDNPRHPDRSAVFELQGDIMPIRELQRRYAAWTLTQLGGHKGKAAEKLGIDAKTLWKWLSNNGGD